MFQCLFAFFNEVVSFSSTWMTSSNTSFTHLPLVYSKYIKLRKLPVLNIQIMLIITYIQDFEIFLFKNQYLYPKKKTFIDIIHNHSLSKV
jgi:hypothetical protein